MATKSPTLNGQPEYLALLGHSPRTSWEYARDKDTVGVVTLVNGKPIHDTGEMSITALLSRNHDIVSYWDFRYSLKQFLIFSRYRRGRKKTVRVPVDTPPTRSFPKSGRMAIPTGGSHSQYPKAVRKGRSRVNDGRNSPAAGIPRTPASSTIRPGTEQRFKAFTRVQETNTLPAVVTVVARETYRRQWTGVRTPGFGKLKKKQLPVNNHTVLIQEWPIGFSSHYNFGFKAPNLSNWGYNLFPYLEVLPEPTRLGHVEQARNKALARLREKSESEIDANLAQDFAQIGQMTRLLGTNVSRITKSIRSLRSGNIPGAINALTAGRTRDSRIRKGKPSRTKDLAENWLELQYGWKPLLHDIYGVTKALSNLQLGDPFVQSVTSSARAERDLTTKFSSHISAIPANIGVRFDRAETRCKITLRWRISSPLKAFMAQTGFTNPVNLVWEILPFSFVVDWFLPIGPYLEALSAWDGLTFIDGSQTQFTRTWMDSSVDYSGVSLVNSTVYQEMHQRLCRNTIELNRVKLITWPNPSLPSFKNGLASVDHCLNGLALLRAAFR